MKSKVFTKNVFKEEKFIFYFINPANEKIWIILRSLVLKVRFLQKLYLNKNKLRLEEAIHTNQIFKGLYIIYTKFNEKFTKIIKK